MWIITGPFDEDHSEGQAPDSMSILPFTLPTLSSPPEQKLLKTGKEYTLGRRDNPLQIKSKAISKAHALFLVAPCSQEDAADPAFVPTLTFQNTTDRIRPVERPSQSRPRVLCQPKTSMQLENGDIIHLSASIFVRVRWEQLCCYNPPAKGVPQTALRECADLGIHLVPTPHPDVTHHLTPSYTLTPAIATSLISAVTLVKPDWLNALLASGRSDEPGELSLLEEHFVLPQTTKFRPGFSPSLPPQLKKYAIWEPNEERSGLFRGHRFVFVGEKGAETQNAMKDLVKRGEGDYECFAAANGKDAFRQVLAKARGRNAILVPVATRDSVTAAVGKDGWSGLVQEATSFEVKFIVPEKIIEAVVHADVSHIDATYNPGEGNVPDMPAFTLFPTRSKTSHLSLTATWWSRLAAFPLLLSRNPKHCPNLLLLLPHVGN
uniref:BscN n=1 Tax=Ganoderma boninense TaxID=34458 RepID=A0A5K1K932_9APHY|nr:BscN [Ganoderma boninense]